MPIARVNSEVKELSMPLNELGISVCAIANKNAAEKIQQKALAAEQAKLKAENDIEENACNRTYENKWQHHICYAILDAGGIFERVACFVSKPKP